MPSVGFLTQFISVGVLLSLDCRTSFDDKSYCLPIVFSLSEISQYLESVVEKRNLLNFKSLNCMLQAFELRYGIPYISVPSS